MSKEDHHQPKEPFHIRAAAFEVDVTAALNKEAAKWEAVGFRISNNLAATLEFSNFLKSGSLSNLEHMVHAHLAKRIANVAEAQIDFEITAATDTQLMQFAEHAFGLVSQLLVKHHGEVYLDRPRAVDYRNMSGTVYYEFSVYFR